MLSDPQLLTFGKITYLYASIEWGIRCMLAGIVETPLVEALILSEPYSASSLKNVAKSAAKLSRLSDENQKFFIQLAGDWGAFANLRNAIAHRRWEGGERPDSIRPAGVDIRSGKAKMIGDVEDRDWLEIELLNEAQKLHDLNERAILFFHKSGLADATALRNKERLSAV